MTSGSDQSGTGNNHMVVQVAELRQKEPPQSRQWKTILDVEEAKKQILFAIPTILTNLAYYMIPVISVMFAGHLGELELAASTLSHSWCGVSGLAFMLGLSGALETLCGQCYGAKLYKMLGLYLQASCIISFFFCILISIFWWFSDAILILLRQDPEISKAAGLYLKFLIPGLFAYALLQNMLRFVQAQSVVVPLVACSLVPVIFEVGITFVLVKKTTLGFRGAALAASISLWIAAIILGLYVLRSSRFKDTRNGFSMESLAYIYTTFKLAVPCAAMVCLEYWAFELLVLLAVLMPNPKITTSVIAMCINTQAICYMLASGLSMAVSTRVSNELGAGNPKNAKTAMNVALKLCVVLGIAIDLAFGFGSHVWAGLFSDSPVIINQFAAMSHFLVISIFITFFPGNIVTGVTRGCGLQHLAVIINFGGFYFIGMPIAGFLSFKVKLYAKGLWIGLISGLTCEACGLLLLVVFKKWSKLDLSRDAEAADTITNQGI